MQSVLTMKIRAFFIHFLLSGLVITLFLSIVVQVWYPGDLFELENVWQGLKILIPVDAILGPVLTAIIFVPGKKHLKLDLAVIAFLQIAALSYGGHIIYQQRPVLISFVVDRFETVLASEIDMNDIPSDRFKKVDKTLPLVTYVLPSQSAEERTHFILNGINIKKDANRHYPIYRFTDELKSAALTSGSLPHLTEKENMILEKFYKENVTQNEIFLFPIQSSNYASKLIAIDTNSGKIVRYVNVAPWKK